MTKFKIFISAVIFSVLAIFLTSGLSTAEIIKGKFDRYNSSKNNLTLSVTGKGWSVKDQNGFVCLYRISGVKNEPWFESKKNLVVELEVKNIKPAGCTRKCQFVAWSGLTATISLNPKIEGKKEKPEQITKSSSSISSKKLEAGEIIKVSGQFEKLYYQGIKLRAYAKEDKIQKYYIFEIIGVTEKDVLDFLKKIEEQNSNMPKISAKIKVKETLGAVIKGELVQWTDSDFVNSVKEFALKSKESIKELEASRLKEYKNDELETVVGKIENYYEREGYFGVFTGGYNAKVINIVDVPEFYGPKILEANKNRLPIKLRVKFLPEEKYKAKEARLVQWIDVNWNSELEKSAKSGFPPTASTLQQLSNNRNISIPSEFFLSGRILRTEVYNAMKIGAKNGQTYLIHNIPNDSQKFGDKVGLNIQWASSQYEFVSWNDETKKLLASNQIDQNKRREEYISDLKKGKIPVTTIDDAVILTNASNNSRYTISPIYDGPSADQKQYFLWSGILTNKFGDIYISWDPEFEKGFAFHKIKKSLGEDLAQNAPVAVVGKYIGNYEIQLVIGTKKLIPLLEDCYVFGLR
jgi:hypothetical protein